LAIPLLLLLGAYRLCAGFLRARLSPLSSFWKGRILVL
jgi:hypothetical protein